MGVGELAGRWGASSRVALLLALLVPLPALAGAMRDIDMGVNTWLVQRPGGTGTPGLVLHQAGGDISASIDAGTPFAVWTEHDAGTGEDALAMRIDPERRPPEASQKSKVEINVARQDDDALDARFGHRFVLRNGGHAALGFTFRMDGQAYEDPQRWVLHMQVWQCCSRQTMPALALQAVPGPGAPAGSVRFALIARNDDVRATPHPASDVGEHLRFDDGSDTIALQKGRDYRIVFALAPDPGTRGDGHMQGGTGDIAMWVDGHPVLHHAGPWGYTPDASGVQATYAVKLGIYRAAQPTRQQVSFGGIRWGTDEASVAAEPKR